MMRRITPVAGIAAALLLAATPLAGQVRQQGSPIDDLLERATNAYNDLNFPRADTLARQVLALESTITAAQRTRALTVIAAAAYPEDVPLQRRSVAVDALKRIVRADLAFTMPEELTWSGLSTLLDEVKRTTFGMEVSADSAQTVVGPTGRATLRVRSSRPGRFQMLITRNGTAVLLDSAVSNASNVAEFQLATMRNEKPLFETGQYDVSIRGVDAATPDTISVRYTITVEAPPLEFAPVPASIDSSKLLKERSGRFGAKAILPALIAGGAAFAFSNTLRPEGEIATTIGGDAKGMAVGGAIAITAIVAGFMDRGRPIPANIAANKAYAEAFAEGVAGVQAENKRRIAEYKTTVRFNRGGAR